MLDQKTCPHARRLPPSDVSPATCLDCWVLLIDDEWLADCEREARLLQGLRAERPQFGKPLKK